MEDRDVWVVARDGGDQLHAWNLGPDAAALHDTVERIKTLLGFPGGDAWAADPSRGWHIQVAAGEPHHTLLAGCTMHDPAELAAVNADTVQAWRDKDTAARREVRIDWARTAIDGLTEDEKIALRAELGWHHG